MTMRVYLALTLEDLEQLAAGEQVAPEAYVAASEDEEDELAALEVAAEQGVVAAAAELDDEDDPVSLVYIASLQLDTDGSGDLAWYATQEIDAVLREARDTTSA
jgi:hypothetical protein